MLRIGSFQRLSVAFVLASAVALGVAGCAVVTPAYVAPAAVVVAPRPVVVAPAPVVWGVVRVR